MRVLFLTHRLPYPPNRGDRIRAFQILRHLVGHIDLELVSLVHDREEQSQAVTLRGLGKAPRQVIWSGECYLVPRADGEILLGATEEEGNYDARPTLSGVNRLTESALEVVPAAGGFVVDGVWAGLRPAAPDRYPIDGWAPGIASWTTSTTAPAALTRDTCTASSAGT